MENADEEINLFLSLVFGLIILFIGAIFGLLIWILNKTKVIEISKTNQLLSVLRASILSIIGVFVLSGILGVVLFIVTVIKSYFTK